jgi:hypothetical protein
MDAQEKQKILLDAFKADNCLYPWLKNYYLDCCSKGDLMINRMLDNFHLQQIATEDQLEYIWHLYTTFTEDYMQSTLVKDIQQ